MIRHRRDNVRDFENGNTGVHKLLMRRLNIRRVEVEDPERSVPFVFLSADGGRDAKSKDLSSTFVFECTLHLLPKST